MSNEDFPRPEYLADLIKSGVRGKYAGKFRERTNAVLIETELHRLFPNTESVNRALRKYAEKHHLSAI